MSKYTVNIKGTNLDVYDIIAAYKITNPAIQHAVKKLLKPGTRGHKDLKTDLNDVIQSVERAKELEGLEKPNTIKLDLHKIIKDQETFDKRFKTKNL